MMKIVKRILALVLGALFALIQIRQVPSLPIPTNARAIGEDMVWIVILGGSVLLLAYGLGLYPRTKKEPTSNAF